mmetsp:Transcript_20476/g.30760  ORF Transcript_20476/g.30760 Transcript_20476/m.30760 type:complete len:873 (-) Transcript_20476:1399-4017(-)
MTSAPLPSSAEGSSRMKKKTANTVFFRYSPSESSITRKNFETYFSDIGPVKKCSLIRADNKKKEDSSAAVGVNREAKGYGFCKFTCQEDAVEAANKLNNSQMALEYGLQVKVWVELADAQSNSGNNTDQKKRRIAATPASNSSSTAPSVSKKIPPEGTPSSDDKAMSTEDLFQLQAKKRTSRVILRNLSFYATEYHIRQTMEEKFGEVVEINLPLVPVKAEAENESNKKRKKQQQQHRGFAFVTFANQKSAQKAVEACASSDEQVLIKKRPVAIDFSVSKFQHRRMKEEANGEEQKPDNGDDDESSEKSENETTDEESKDDSDSSDSSDDDSDSSDSEEEQEGDMDKTKVENSHQHSLFLRNLPFDTTRHDVFTLFAKFGRIDAIHLVKDRDTGLAKGTAFVKYEKEGGCQRALEASSRNSTSDNIKDFQSEKNMMSSLNGGSGGLFLRGRRILVDKAVDKSTAESLKVQRDEDGKPIDKKIGKDKRNLYLKGEGRVMEGGKETTDPNSWENIPQSDQMKRGRAHQEKHTKLRSPLFFINPFRLSIRNLGKHIDESQLKVLAAMGIEKGLEKNLVSKEDVLSHWRAGGELTAREIIQRLNASDGDEDIIPIYDSSEGIKKYVPSVFIDRDFQGKDGKASKVLAPSRGFGFVEFTHHAHALACLRELNNNTAYSAEFVAGGKKASLMKKKASSRKRKKGKIDTDVDHDFLGEDGKVHIPRLIVEFTVENKAKARKQAERKAQQLANVQKQKAAAKQSLDENGEKKKKKKKSRGALQREKKRKLKEEGPSETDQIDTKEDIAKKQKISEEDSNRAIEEPPKNKGIKPQKKKKIDKDENAFQDMIKSYKKAFTGDNKGNEEKSERSEITKKRWFE